MQETRSITKLELYDLIRTLEVMRKVEEQSKVYTNNNEAQIMGFEEEVA